MRRALLISLFSLVAAVASPEITLRISIDPGPDVLLYSPVFVVVTVTNEGKAPVLLPINEGERGWYVDVRSGNNHFPYRLTTGPNTVNDAVTWLPPGAHYYLYDDIGRGIALGEYQVQAVLRSDGRCRLLPDGTEPYKVVPLPPRGPFVENAYECWSGEEESQIETISVKCPSTAIDNEALEFAMTNPHVVGPDPHRRFLLGYRELKERFPSSAYTAIAAIHAGADTEVSEVPDSPLTTYARFRYAMRWACQVDDVKDYVKGLPPYYAGLVLQRCEQDKAYAQRIQKLRKRQEE